MERDTEGTVAAWKEARSTVVDPIVDDHSGRIVNFWRALDEHFKDAMVFSPEVLDRIGAQLIKLGLPEE